MAKSRKQKKEIIEKLHDVVKSASSIVFVAFRGLKVTDTTAMRKELRKVGVMYVVAKKTLLGRVLGESKVHGSTPALVGEIALAYGADSLSPAREMYVAVKKYKDNLAIIGGVFEGKYVGKDEMISLAMIPNREVLYAQFANVLASPATRFAVALSKIAEKKSV